MWLRFRGGKGVATFLGILVPLLPVAALVQRIAEDRRAGLHPFLVVSSAGTTNLGALLKAKLDNKNSAQ